MNKNGTLRSAVFAVNTSTSMKQKNRRIMVNQQLFLYCIKNTYVATADPSCMAIRVFNPATKQKIGEIRFHTLDDYYVGAPLNHGVALMNRSTACNKVVNLNRPYFVRLFIEQLLLEESAQPFYDGMTYLAQLGFNTEKIEPKKRNLR